VKIIAVFADVQNIYYTTRQAYGHQFNQPGTLTANQFWRRDCFCNRLCHRSWRWKATQIPMTTGLRCRQPPWP